MADNGWIKLHRKMLDWEWYSDVNTTRLFIHLLLTVNVKDYEWRGVHVHRGSRITSVATLSNETALSDRQVRTALDHLISTNEITKQTTNQYTLISIVNYDSYQSNDKPPDQRSDKQNDQRSDKPDNSRERREMAACDDCYEVNDKQSVNQTTSETTNEVTNQRQAARQSNDKPPDQRSDKRNDQRSDKPATSGTSIKRQAT